MTDFYVPPVGGHDKLRAECGEMHAVYEWEENVRLRGRWPSRGVANKARCSHKQCVAAYHWKALGQSREGVLLAAATWSDSRAVFERWERPGVPIVVVAVSIRNKLSQYLGWIPPERFMAIQPTDVLPWSDTFTVMKRVVTPGRLLSGFPRELAEQGELFE